MATGIKVSRTGYDVNTASDKQLAFSSEWPLLPIEAEGDITINVPGGGAGIVTQTLYTHNLGYEPVFYAHRVSGGFCSLSYFRCDDEKVWFSGYVSANINIKWKVFRRPIKTNYEASNINLSDATPGVVDDDYGILVSLPGKSVESTDKRDFGIRSDCRQLMIHKSGYTPSKVQGVTVTHNLGYKPMYFIYQEDNSNAGEYFFVTAFDTMNVVSTTSQISFYISFPIGCNWAYILFKDTLTTNG